jgi:hypothetical protein
MSAFIIFSCSPERRLTRILEKNPHLLKTDSVLVVDSIFLPGEKIKGEIVDSALYAATKKKPIVLDSGKVRTIIYRYDNKTIVESECKPDTILHKHYNIKNHYTTNNRKSIRYYWLFFLLCFVSSVVGVLLTHLFLIKR